MWLEDLENVAAIFGEKVFQYGGFVPGSSVLNLDTY